MWKCQVVMCWLGCVYVHTLIRKNTFAHLPSDAILLAETHTNTNTDSSSTYSLFDVHCSKSGSRLLSVYCDWSQCDCLVFRQWMCSQNADFHSCCLLMGFFPLSHRNWLLLLLKLAVTFCLFVLGILEPVYLGLIVQFGKLKKYLKKLSLKIVYL